MTRNAWFVVVGLAVVVALGVVLFAIWPKRYAAAVALVSPTPQSATFIDDDTPPVWEARMTGGDARAVMAATQKFQSDVLEKADGRLEDFSLRVDKFRHQYIIGFCPTENLHHYAALGIPPYATISFLVSRSDYAVTGGVMMEPAVHPPPGRTQCE